MEIFTPLFLIIILYFNGIQTTYETENQTVKLYQEIKKHYDYTSELLSIGSNNPETRDKKYTLLFIITNYYNFIQKSVEELNIDLKTLKNKRLIELDKLKDSLKGKIKFIKKENLKYILTTKEFYVYFKIKDNVFFNHSENILKLFYMTRKLINNYAELIA